VVKDWLGMKNAYWIYNWHTNSSLWVLENIIFGDISLEEKIILKSDLDKSSSRNTVLLLRGGLGSPVIRRDMLAGAKVFGTTTHAKHVKE
jgi:hypothetical protein